MGLRAWDPWEEIERLQAETNRLWEQCLHRLVGSHATDEPIQFVPPVDLVETEQTYELYLSLPGLVEEDIDLAIRQQTLTIRGQREIPYVGRRVSCRLNEERYGCFERRIEFPQAIDTDSLHARYEAGVLSITIGKIR